MAKKSYIVRDTASRKGRNISLTPRTTPLKALSCGRIILGDSKREASASSKGREVSLICLAGEGIVRVGGQDYKMGLYDALYIPPGNTYEVSTSSTVDIAEASAPTKKAGRVQFIPFEVVKNDPKLHAHSGKPTYSRDIYKMIDVNVPADRLLCGMTFGDPGNWTSWSPHEHGQSKEEVYLYLNMPKPGFGIQLLYDKVQKPYFVTTVFENDAVVITRGYHPNVAAPGYGMNFLWMMAALNPEKDRDWNIMHWQEEFAGRY
ncbi:MAG TPA: 5-deoxy-glucuronate isomerase [Bacteroidota bacterium]|nr:5-deoxy-glucuronate isomerase [Bacteroidota bacterium]